MSPINGSAPSRRFVTIGRRVGGVVAVAIVAAAASAEDRTFDGSGNNTANPGWGSAGVALLRLAPAAYDDGVSTPAAAGRLSARLVSNMCAIQDVSMPNVRQLSDLATFWGQFLDHDIDLSPGASPIELLPIQVPLGDPWFDPFSEGDKIIPFARTVWDPATGTGPRNPRQQVNEITAFIDASMVYGSSLERAEALRTMDGTGKLAMSAGNLLPFNTLGLENANDVGAPDESLHVAGDVRANETIGLLALHTLFAREHNRLCDQLALAHPDWDGEQIYQRARKIVGAEIQAITYYEFLPALLGDDAIPAYTGYDADVNPGIANVFSTACYRLGHSLVNHSVLRFDDGGRVIPEGHLPLIDSFFNPARLAESGLEPVFRGLEFQTAQNIDTRVVTGLRTFLFGPPGSGGLDLVSLNIQRGRDHGLPPYNNVRAAYGLSLKTSFAQVSSDPEVQAALAAAYASVNDIDVWVGSVAEDLVPGAAVGELVRTVVADQLVRLRDGDRFYFENDPAFTPTEIDALRGVRLSDVIEANTAAEVDADVFIAPGAGTPVFADIDGNGTVGIGDLLTVLGEWGPVQATQVSGMSDVNADGLIGVADLLVVLAEWGNGYGG